MVQDAVMHATLDVPVAIIAVTKVGVEDIRYFPARGLEETLPLETTYANRATFNESACAREKAALHGRKKRMTWMS